MPKMKTRTALQGRVRLTPSGKISRTQGNVRHLLTNRTPKTLRNARKKATTTAAGYTRRVRFAFQKGQP
jgi:ribosomal protein L35